MIFVTLDLDEYGADSHPDPERGSNKVWEIVAEF
jgi:hypothetical protein